MPAEEQRRRSSSVSRPFDPNNGWSDDIENVLESIRHNAFVMSEHHKKNYQSYKAQLKYYKIPVIIISGLNSVIAVGLQPYLEQGIISGSNCLLALLCGIIGSIELFLGISAGMENELVASKNFYLLAISIYKTLMLDRERRPVIGRDFLEEVYSEYTKYYGSSALVTMSKKTNDKLAQIPLKNVGISQSPVFEDTDSDNGSPVRQFNVVPIKPKSTKQFNVQPRDRYQDEPASQTHDFSDMMEKGTASMNQYSNMAQSGQNMMENAPFGINSPFGQSLKMVADPFTRQQMKDEAISQVSSNVAQKMNEQVSTLQTQILQPISEGVETINDALTETETTKKVATELVNTTVSNVVKNLGNKQGK